MESELKQREGGREAHIVSTEEWILFGEGEK